MPETEFPDMNNYTEFPDILPAFLDAVQTALVADTVKVAEDLTGYHAGDKRVTMQFTGGVFVNPNRVARPRFDINVYASTKPLALQIALKAVKAIYDMKNHVGSNFVVTEVDCSYPQDLSDPINHNPRFVFDTNISYRFR